VRKFHDGIAAAVFSREPGGQLFITARTALKPDAESTTTEAHWAPTARAAKRKLKAGCNVSYVQILDTLKDRGYRVSRDYDDALGLDVARSDALMDYLRYWDVLRVCCGKQMSGDYRDRLQRKHAAETGANNPSIKNYTPHRNESDGKPLSGTPFQVPRFLEPN
jgi:hypothetical protein